MPETLTYIEVSYMPVPPKLTALTQERARELFDYDPDTGILTRRCDVHSGRGSESGGGKIQCRVGDVAGKFNKSTGYLECRVDGPAYKVHRIIWCWYYGYLPEHDIDHINADKADNRISNLREVSRSCNIRNRPVLRSNTSGIPGVGYDRHSGKWKANITNLGKRTILGSFDCKIEAAAHRLCAEQFLDWNVCDKFSIVEQYVKRNQELAL